MRFRDDLSRSRYETILKIRHAQEPYEPEQTIDAAHFMERTAAGWWPDEDEARPDAFGFHLAEGLHL